MKTSDWRYLVDALLFVCFVGMTVIGALMGFVLATGPVVSESSKYFLGLHRHQWGNIHADLSIAFVCLIVVHLILSWKWITAQSARIFKRLAAPVLVVLALLPALVLFVFWVFTPKDVADYEGYGIDSPGRGRMRETAAPGEAPVAGASAVREGQASGNASPIEPEHRTGVSEEGDHRAVGSLVITGRLTLMDIEQETGLSARAVADRLGLPSSAPLDETLGRLKQRYGFEMEAVRDLVERMLTELK